MKRWNTQMMHAADGAVFVLFALMVAAAIAAAWPTLAHAASATAETEIGVVFVEEPEASQPDGEDDPGRGQAKPLPSVTSADEFTSSLALTGDTAAGLAVAIGLLALGALVCAAVAGRAHAESKETRARHGR